MSGCVVQTQSVDPAAGAAAAAAAAMAMGLSQCQWWYSGDELP
jgi:hypothetical protein